MATPPMSFEAALEALEAIVAKMEKGDLPLDESLQSFEQGITLSKFCESKLQEAEGKVEKLLAATTSAQTGKTKRKAEITDGEEDVPF